MGVFPFEPLLVPVLFALPPGAGQLLVVPVRPVPVTSLNAGKAMRGSDSSRWLTLLLAQHAPQVEPASGFHPLLPRPIRGNRLALPVWAAVRLNAADTGRDTLDLERPERALDRLADELGDPGFAQQVMASVRSALASDPFAQRIVGDDARMGALSQEPLSKHPAEVLPAVVALLPEHFTLGELQQAIAATLGLPPGAMESSSSFRRRLQEFVHRRVLREVHSPRDASDGERIGRPPRHYVFDPHAWHDWLAERGGRASSRGTPDAGSEWQAAARLLQSRLDSESGSASFASAAPDDLESAAAMRMSRPRSMQAPAPAPGARLERLERMVERLAEELRKRPRDDA